jgi:phosphopantetheinyl transferase (holo-ACP synthase)
MKRIEIPWPNVLVLSGAAPLTLDEWFDESELAIANAFERPKRRREWMLARVALKMLIAERGAAAYSSFSHSGDYAAAAIGDVPVGVDVQVIRPLSERAAHLFLADDEREAMERCSIADRILHFFCAKEAAWKARGGAVPTLKQIPLKLKEETASGLLFDAAATYATGEIIVASSTS